MGRKIGKNDIRILLQNRGPHFTIPVAADCNILTQITVPIKVILLCSLLPIRKQLSNSEGPVTMAFTYCLFYSWKQRPVQHGFLRNSEALSPQFRELNYIFQCLAIIYHLVSSNIINPSREPQLSWYYCLFSFFLFIVIEEIVETVLWDPRPSGSVHTGFQGWRL